MPRLNSKSPTPPSPADIREARKVAGLTQTEAAGLLYVTLNGWQRWEHGESPMHPAFWELFLVKISD